jgi:N-acetylmuramoyl-L-alanine amidase
VLAAAVTIAMVLATVASPGRAAGAPAGRAVDPARFLPGSCVAFAARGAAAGGRTVFIDAGHGGPDPGAVGVTLAGHPVHEATETLRVALDALPLLRHAGYTVVLSRTTAAQVVRPAPGDLDGGLFTAQGVRHDLAARDACANLVHAALLVGVYFDASDYSSVAGSLTLYDAARPFWPASARFARLLQRDVLARLNGRGNGIPDDGVHNDVGYGSAVSVADESYPHLLILGPAKRGYFSGPSQMPGALIEPLYVTDPAEASLANSRAGEHEIARGIATAVEEYFRSRSGAAQPAIEKERRTGRRPRPAAPATRA